jgi:hypothetical protein
MQVVLLANAFATFFMTGLIWFVQVVHYPLFAAVGAAEFPGYSRAHQFRTTLVVAPVMLVEALSTLLLALEAPAGTPPALAWIGVALLALIWISTAALQVPAHARLSTGFDGSAARRLVASNWIRTVAWSARALVAIAMLALTTRHDG